MINRIHSKNILNSLQKGKVLLLYGARRTGKTTIIKEIKKQLEIENKKVLLVNGENFEIQNIFKENNLEQFKLFIGKNKFLFIDEAQSIENIGKRLKFIIDELPEISIIASGSASFELAQKVGEPLIGRKKTFTLFPISITEICDNYGVIKQKELLEEELIFGTYPELFSLSQKEKINYLHELVDSSLFKDILVMENLKAPKKLKDILILLAFQIGKEVSISEIGQKLGMHNNTVNRYLDLLEKSFIIKNIRALSRNLRNEITKTSRYYFYDNGIRNALIQAFTPISLRNDIGMLWENFIVMELLKKQEYKQERKNNFFWRTYQQQEIDFIEEFNDMFYAYEMKWKNKKVKIPNAFIKSYPNTKFIVINNENYLEYLA